MISKEELAQCLREANYTEEQIQRALNSQISSVLNKGKIDRINNRLKVLEELTINKDKVIEGISLLISGSDENIKDNYKTLRDMNVSQEGIEDRLIILARGKKDKMQANMKVLLEHNLTMEQISSCLTLLMENEADEIDKILTTLENHNIGAELLDEHTLLLLLAKRKEAEIRDVLEDLDEYNMDDNTTKACLRLIYDGKATLIKSTAKILKTSNLSQEMKNRVLADTVAGKIKEVDETIITLLNCSLDLEQIEKDATLRRKSNVDEISATYTALSKYTLTQNARENYLKQIYAHKWKPIYEIVQSIERHNISQGLVEENLEQLLQNAPKVAPEIDSILTSLEEYHPSEETMRACLSLISTQKGTQVQKCINSLRIVNVQPEIKEGLLPYVLSRKSKTVDEKLITLVNAGINLDTAINSMPKVYSIEHEELQKRIHALQNNEHYSINIATTENAMDIILKNTADEIDAIFTGMGEYEVGEETQRRCLKLMATARGKEIQSIIQSLEKHNISKETGKSVIDELLKSRPEVTEGILTALGNHNISPITIENNLGTLVKSSVSPSRIDQTLTAYEKHGISKETRERTISHMSKVRADDVDDTLTAVLNYGISQSIVEEKINLLSEAKADEVKKRIEAIKTNEYYDIPVEAVENCMAILLNNNSEEIKETLKVLHDNNVSERSVHEYLIIVALENAEQLKEIFTSLNGYDLNEETINGCLKLITEHKGSNIPEIITHLKNHNISKEAVQEALKDLLRNKPNDIDEMLTALEEHKITPKTINSSLKLLAQGYVKKEKVNKVLGAYKKYEFSKEAIENAISGLGKAKVDEIEGVLKVTIVDYKINVEALGKALNSLSTAKESEVRARLETLTKNDYYNIPIDAIEGCIGVLTRNTAEEMLAILKTLHDHNVSEEAVFGCLSVLAYGNDETVKKVLEQTGNLGINIEDCMFLLLTKNPEKIGDNYRELIEYGIDPEAINNCLSITSGNFEKMHEVMKVVKKHTIGARAVENCLSVLLAGDANEVDQILTTLEKERIHKRTMERCLSMLPFTKNKKVEDFITKLNNHHLEPSAIENNLTVVMEANLDEMDGILDILTDLGMPLEDNLSILKYTTAKRLGEIVEYMQGQRIRDDAIKRELKSIVRDDGKLGIKVEDIFERRNSEDRKVQLKKARRYMKLTGMLGQYYTREEIEPFCQERNITVREFVEGIVCSNMNKSSIGRPNSISEIYYERIMDGKRLYVGPSKPIDPEYLEEHAEEVLELARISARKFLTGRQTPDEDELRGLATELIMSKCGNLVDNLQDYPNALRGSIVNRTARYLYSVVEQNLTISMTRKVVSRSGEVEIKDKEYSGDVNGDNPYEPETSLHEVVDYEKAEFDQDETDIMNYMIRLIEEGEADDLYQKIAENFGMEEDEVLEAIQSIRQKLKDKGLVRENVERGGYEFNRNDDDIDVDGENFDI